LNALLDGASRIIAVDANPAKLKTAMELGGPEWPSKARQSHALGVDNPNAVDYGKTGHACMSTGRGEGPLLHPFQHRTDFLLRSATAYRLFVAPR
jgi:hypothetical protein